MRAGRRAANWRSRWSPSLRASCLQVGATTDMMNYQVVHHICTKADSNLFFSAGPERMDLDPPALEPNDSPFTDLSVNSMVEVSLANGNSYGIIRWIGSLPGRVETMAGLELVIFVSPAD